MIKPKSGNPNWDRHIFLKPWGLGGDAKSLLFIVQYLEMSLFHAPSFCLLLVADAEEEALLLGAIADA